MNQPVSTLAMRKEKVSLWTPWGVQKVPDLDRVLEPVDKPRKSPRLGRKTLVNEPAAKNER